jgi:predicted DNA-binding transcriptional regulator AlpA
VKALAAEWEDQCEESRRTASLVDHFKSATPSQLIRMWESGVNEYGRRLSPFELGALIERWCLVFGDLPPRLDHVSAANDPEPIDEHELPDDDTMLSSKDVVRITGVSLSTINRMAADGRFPQPMHLSPRRIGWPAREVKAWIDTVDLQRRKPRQ